jgi:hypothetical protein
MNRYSMEKFTQKICILILTFLCLLSSACSPTVTETPFPVASTAPATQTLHPSPAPTATPQPTLTPAPPTLTPLPTISTFTPTFDVRTIVTATPAPKAECPKVTSINNPQLEFLDNETQILDFLNKYGAGALKTALHKAHWVDGRDFAFKDLTNDSVPEVALRADTFYIFGCINGIYKTLLSPPPDGRLIPPSILTIADGNHNNIPEVVLLTEVQSQGGQVYRIYEWGENKFTNLIPSIYPDAPDEGEISIEVNGKIYYKAISSSAIDELVVESGIPLYTTYYDGLPLRNKTTYFRWNGADYAPAQSEFTPPEFRFQAIQDSDLALAQLEYAKAFELYKQAIFNEKLKSYSPEIRKNLQEAWEKGLTNDQPSPTPAASDSTEYPKLAAYAYYRMVILHIKLGEMDAAQTQYATLLEKFPTGNPGHPYVEMATAFWDAYQSSQNMTDACGAAIEYAAERPEILTVLGSDYHGWQSHTYVPADVCPFR